MGLLKAAFLIGMLQCANSAVQDANSGVMGPKSRRRLAKLSIDRYPTCSDCGGYGHYQTDHYKTNCGCAGSDRLTDRVTRGCPAERRCEKCTCNTCKGSGVMGPRRRLGKLSTDRYPDCPSCNGYGQYHTNYPATNCGCPGWTIHTTKAGDEFYVSPSGVSHWNEPVLAKSARGCPAEKRCEKCTCKKCDGSGVIGPKSRKRRSLAGSTKPGVLVTGAGEAELNGWYDLKRAADGRPKCWRIEFRPEAGRMPNDEGEWEEFNQGQNYYENDAGCYIYRYLHTWDGVTDSTWHIRTPLRLDDCDSTTPYSCSVPYETDKEATPPAQGWECSGGPAPAPTLRVVNH